MDIPVSLTVPTPGVADPRAGATRTLSPTERWYWIADQLSTNNCAARVRVEGELSMTALRGALGALQARHPLLRQAITAELSGVDPRFVPTDNPIPLREVVLARPDDARWADELDGTELAHPLDWRSGPLARAVVVSQPGQVHDLIISAPHCVADGTTVLALLRQWVRLTAEPPPAGQPVPSGSVLPPEARFPARHRETSVELPDLPTGGADPGAVERDVTRLAPERFVPFDRRRTRLLHRFLAGDALEGLALACRREGVSMHGVLAAAMVSAVARDLGAPTSASFAIGSPVDFRDELDPPVSEDEIGSFVSALPSVVRYRPDDLWSMARSVNREIRERRERGEHFLPPRLLAERGPAGVADSGPFVRFMEEHGPFNVFISNMGRFDFPDTLGAWRLSGAQVVGGISVIGYFAAVACTSQGQLSWNFLYVDEAISLARAERLADASMAAVLAAASTA
ncbi:phthiocerol/phthiodiolone dimycocerosyl transferase family protein [Solihabitans fulvus]|nr:condensation domain-containing protein [Solihabitans fulvus]